MKDGSRALHVSRKVGRSLFFFFGSKEEPRVFNMQPNLVSKEDNLRHHYETNHSKNFDWYAEKIHDKKLHELKKKTKLSTAFIIKYR